SDACNQNKQTIPPNAADKRKKKETEHKQKPNKEGKTGKAENAAGKSIKTTETDTTGGKITKKRPRRKPQSKQTTKHQETYRMNTAEDLNETINVHIKKSHIEELADAGGIKDRSSKARLGRIINSVGVKVPLIAETTLGNKLTFSCTRGTLHYLNNEIALRGDSRVFFEICQEDETAKQTIMIMDVTNPLRKDPQTIAKEVAEAFDKFAGVASKDQYGKEDPNSRSGKVVVTLSYTTEEEKTQALEVLALPFNGHHVYPVDPNEPVLMRIEREKPRWLIAPDLEEGTELKDWFKVKDIKFQRIRITRDGLEILVTTAAEVNRWDGKKVSDTCTSEKNRKQLKKNDTLSTNTQQLTTQANGYEAQVTVHRKYVMDHGAYRLRDHCCHCQGDHPSHLCQTRRQQEESDWKKVADEQMVYKFSSADIKRLEKSVKGYVERNGGLTQAEARGCQTLRIKIDSAWVQKEDGRHHQRPRPPPTHTQTTKPTLGRRMDNAWPIAQPTNTNQPHAAYNTTANHTNAATTSTWETQIRELVKKVISEEITNTMENLVNSRIAEELEEWKNELRRERDERLAEEEAEQETQSDEMNEDKTNPGSSPSSTWMEAVDKAISRMEENQLRTDRNIERIDRNVDRLEVETGVAQGLVFDSNDEAMDIEDEDAEATTPNALKLGRTKNE
ncbi:hypothetical protein BDR26DRAFT_968783, partial [Obelidium mucronatum]